jgi:hypothetical protein
MDSFNNNITDSEQEDANVSDDNADDEDMYEQNQIKIQDYPSYGPGNPENSVRGFRNSFMESNKNKEIS